MPVKTIVPPGVYMVTRPFTTLLPEEYAPGDTLEVMEKCATIDAWVVKGKNGRYTLWRDLLHLFWNDIIIKVEKNAST
jgi:hypothetical protein